MFGYVIEYVSPLCLYFDYSDCPAVCPDGSQGGLVPDTSHPTVNFLNMLWDPENLILTSVYFGYLLILLAAVVFKPGILGVKSANVVPNEAIDVAESGPQSPRGGRRISNARPEGNGVLVSFA